MSKANELILYEGFYWDEIVKKLQSQFSPLPPAFSDEAEALRLRMSALGFFQTNRGEDKGLRFVGSFHHTLCGQAFHFWVLPKYLKDSNLSAAVMPSIMAAISKAGHLYDFADEAEFLESRRNSVEKKVHPHQLATWLVQDYNSNGIFFVKEKRNSMQKKGRINWPRTISRKMPFLEGDDVFYTAPIYTSINQNNQTLLSEIHKCAVREALDYLSAYGQASDTIPPKCDASMLGKLEQYVPIVHNFQRVVFSNREIYLLRALEAWCHHQSRYYKLPIGTVLFHKVWEKALHDVFGNISEKFTFGSPEYRLGTKDGRFQIDNDEIPDTIRIFKEDDDIRFLLLDAKYYLGSITGSKRSKTELKRGYQWIVGFPGYKDIAKQVDYRRTLEHKYGLTNGVNAFVMPWYDIEGLPLSSDQEQALPWVRYLGYATKGDVDKETDEVCKLLESLGGLPDRTEQTSEKKESATEQAVLVVQIKPEWLWQEFLRSSQNSQLSLDLWHFLKQSEAEMLQELNQERTHTQT